MMALTLLTTVGAVADSPGEGVDYYADRFLICFRPVAGKITLSVSEEAVVTGLTSLDGLFEKYRVIGIEPWLPMAVECDHWGDIHLSRIHRVWFDGEKASVDEVVRAFAGNEHLLYAEPEGITRFCYTPNDPRYPQQWYLQQIKADLAWNLWTDLEEVPGDTTIVIGIVDTGVDWDHPDLLGNLWQNLREDADGDGHTVEWADTGWILDPGDLNGVDDDDWDDDPGSFVDDLIGWDFGGTTSGDDPDNDPDGPPLGSEVWMHGTGMAGIAAAATNNGLGIASTAWRVRFMPVKVSYDEDQGAGISHGYDGILYAAMAGAHIINCSWGGYGSGSSACAVVNTAHESYGATICCAHGGDPFDPTYPAACSLSISVTATTFGDVKAAFAEYGPTVDICAPGDHILTTIYADVAPGYSDWSGVVTASPLVASAFGLLKSMFPDSGNAWLERELLESCDDIDSLNPGYEGLLGHGRVNVYRAIASNLFPDLQFVSSVVQEDSGDGDGELEPGETARLVVTLRNEEGWLPAEDVRAWLRTSDDRIEVADSVGSYGDILGGSVVGNFGDFFQFVLLEDMAGDSSITVAMKVMANDGADRPYWTTHQFSIDFLDGVGEANEALAPEGYWLAPNFPNPFNAETEIAFTLAKASPVALRVYNLRGELVRVLVSGREGQGHNRVRWDGRNERGGEVASGVYLCRLLAEDFTATRKLLLLR